MGGQHHVGGHGAAGECLVLSPWSPACTEAWTGLETGQLGQVGAWKLPPCPDVSAAGAIVIICNLGWVDPIRYLNRMGDAAL